MEKQIITVVLNNRPYHLTLEVEHHEEKTIYRVAEDQESRKLADVIPEPLEFSVDGVVTIDDRIKTVEGQEIAREIWEVIRKKFGEPGEEA